MSDKAQEPTDLPSKPAEYPASQTTTTVEVPAAEAKEGEPPSAASTEPVADAKQPEESKDSSTKESNEPEIAGPCPPPVDDASASPVTTTTTKDGNKEEEKAKGDAEMQEEEKEAPTKDTEMEEADKDDAVMEDATKPEEATGSAEAPLPPTGLPPGADLPGFAPAAAPPVPTPTEKPHTQQQQPPPPPAATTTAAVAPTMPTRVPTPPTIPPFDPASMPINKEAAAAAAKKFAAAVAAMSTTTKKAVPKKKAGKRGKHKGPPRPTFVVNLGSNDVLMGRGSLFADYDGNVRLRKVVTDHRDAYASSSKHKDKQQIVRSIIEAVQALGGRFLRRVELTKEQKKAQKSNNSPSYMWTVVDDEKLVIDKVKQLFRDARLTRRLRRRKTPMEGEELAQTDLTAPKLLEPPKNPPGITAAPGSVEEQLQLQRMQRQQKPVEHTNPLEEQLQQLQEKQKQSSMQLEMKQTQEQQKQMQKQQKQKKGKKGDKTANAAAATYPLATQSPGVHPMAPPQPGQAQPMQLNNLAGGGMNLPMNLPGAGMNMPGGGMNLAGAGGMNLAGPVGMAFPGGMNLTGDMGQNFLFQSLRADQERQQQELVFLAEQERQELALRAEQMRQEQERQELAFRAQQMRQEQEQFAFQQERQQQQELQALRAEQDRQELANFLRTGQAGGNDTLRQLGQQQMGIVQNDGGLSFGAFPPDSLNRVNNPSAATAAGRSGLVDLARLAELMQATGQFPNQFNNQGGQQM